MIVNLFFFNRCFDKNRLKNLISWSLKNYGEKNTIQLVENLKDLGFQYATQAGISLSLDDLKIPPTKSWLVSEAEIKIRSTELEYKRGHLTAVEKFQQLIDTWHRSSETLKQNVVQHFRSTNILNPVYMMAFSGARGNLSQVRQLVGMRGLMADPQGQIIDFPIRSNFREGLTLTEYVISCYGARKGLVDTALRTANSGYLTRRLVDVSQHVIVCQLDCGTRHGIFLSDMKQGQKTILSLENRLIGRVLAEDIRFFTEDKKDSKRDMTYLQSPLVASKIVSQKENIKFQTKKSKNKYYLSKTSVLIARNQEISASLASKIIKLKKKVLVRSPLTCEAKNSICQLCYGWSLAHGNLVSLGEAVGIIAAQSIGEPGTQLTMRTFHTGGVFSGDVMEEIRAPFTGVIQYSEALQGILVRTPHGKVGFLTKTQGELILTSFSNFSLKNSLKLDQKIKKFRIPNSTILFIREGEIVLENQLIAEFSSMSTQSNQRIQAKHNLNSELEGQIFFEDVLLGVKLGKEGDLTRTALKLGSIWVLSGKLYQSMLPSVFFPRAGDLIDTKSLMNQTLVLIPYTGFIEPRMLIPEYSKNPNSGSDIRVIAHEDSNNREKSLKESVFQKYIGKKKNRDEFSGNYLKIRHFNSKAIKQIILSKSIGSLNLKNVQYKKYGYFLDVSVPERSPIMANPFFDEVYHFNGLPTLKQRSSKTWKQEVSFNKSIFRKTKFFLSNSIEQELKDINQIKQFFYLQWFPSNYKTKRGGILFLEANYLNENSTEGQFFWVSEEKYKFTKQKLFSPLLDEISATQNFDKVIPSEMKIYTKVIKKDSILTSKLNFQGNPEIFLSNLSGLAIIHKPKKNLVRNLNSGLCSTISNGNAAFAPTFLCLDHCSDTSVKVDRNERSKSSDIRKSSLSFLKVFKNKLQMKSDGSAKKLHFFIQDPTIDLNKVLLPLKDSQDEKGRIWKYDQFDKVLSSKKKFQKIKIKKIFYQNPGIIFGKNDSFFENSGFLNSIKQIKKNLVKFYQWINLLEKVFEIGKADSSWFPKGHPKGISIHESSNFSFKNVFDFPFYLCLSNDSRIKTIYNPEKYNSNTFGSIRDATKLDSSQDSSISNTSSKTISAISLGNFSSENYSFISQPTKFTKQKLFLGKSKISLTPKLPFSKIHLLTIPSAFCLKNQADGIPFKPFMLVDPKESMGEESQIDFVMSKKINLKFSSLSKYEKNLFKQNDYSKKERVSPSSPFLKSQNEKVRNNSSINKKTDFTNTCNKRKKTTSNSMKDANSQLNNYVQVTIKPGWLYFPKNQKHSIKYHQSIQPPGSQFVDDILFDQHMIYSECISTKNYSFSNFLKQAKKSQLNFDLKTTPSNAAFALKKERGKSTIIADGRELDSSQPVTRIYPAELPKNYYEQKSKVKNKNLHLKKLLSFSEITKKITFKQMVAKNSQLSSDTTKHSRHFTPQKKATSLYEFLQMFFFSSRKINTKRKFFTTTFNKVLDTNQTKKVLLKCNVFLLSFYFTQFLFLGKTKHFNLFKIYFIGNSKHRFYKILNFTPFSSARDMQKGFCSPLLIIFDGRELDSSQKLQKKRNLVSRFFPLNTQMLTKTSKISSKEKNRVNPFSFFFFFRGEFKPKLFILVRKASEYTLVESFQYKKLVYDSQILIHEETKQFQGNWVTPNFENFKMKLTSLPWLNKQKSTNLISPFPAVDFQVDSFLRLKSSPKSHILKQTNFLEVFLSFFIPSTYPLKYTKIKLIPEAVASNSKLFSLLLTNIVYQKVTTQNLQSQFLGSSIKSSFGEYSSESSSEKIISSWMSIRESLKNNFIKSFSRIQKSTKEQNKKSSSLVSLLPLSPLLLRRQEYLRAKAGVEQKRKVISNELLSSMVELGSSLHYLNTFNSSLNFSFFRKIELSSFLISEIKNKNNTLKSIQLLLYSNNWTFKTNPLSLTCFFSPYEGEITNIKTDSFGKQSCLFLTTSDQLSFSNPFQEFKNPCIPSDEIPYVRVGQLMRYGEECMQNLAITASGQIIQVENSKVVLRKAQPVLFSSRGVFHVYHKDFVEKNSPLLTLFYQRLKTGDIVQGIPQIEQFFEARQTKEGEILPENLHTKLREFFEISKQHFSPQEAARRSLEKIQRILVDGVQRVYQSQGVTIADKHLEVIVRQMTSKVKILEGGQSGLLRGELIDLDWIEVVNKGIHAQKAEYEPVILGITKAALETESFISAASFQETTRILARAAIERKTDFLRGLKENVILGHLIPAGTGFSLSFDPEISKYSDKNRNKNENFFRNVFRNVDIPHE